MKDVITENYQLMFGDCLERMKEIPDGSIDLTVTSPPYDNLRTYAGTLEWNFEIFKQGANELYRVTKDGGVVVWVVGDATIKAAHTYAENIDFSKIKTDKDLVVYIDPPYKGTTGYKDTIDLSLVIDRAKCVGAKVFVSEYYNLSDNFTILSETTKGGISGDRKGSMVEYLSVL